VRACVIGHQYCPGHHVLHAHDCLQLQQRIEARLSPSSDLRLRIRAHPGACCAPRALVTIPIRQVRMGAGLVPLHDTKAQNGPSAELENHGVTSVAGDRRLRNLPGGCGIVRSSGPSFRSQARCRRAHTGTPNCSNCPRAAVTSVALSLCCAALAGPVAVAGHCPGARERPNARRLFEWGQPLMLAGTLRRAHWWVAIGTGRSRAVRDRR
jgi:hypothetical protein